MTWIALSGAHYVGKTSLIEAVVGRYAEPVTVVGNVMRRLHAAGLSVGVESNLATMAGYLGAQLPDEDTAVRDAHLISDRVMLDGLCYVLAARDLGLATYAWNDDEISLLRAVAHLQVLRYSEHVFIPIEFEVAGDDPLHNHGEELRVAVQGHLLTETETWPIRTHWVSGPIEARADVVRELLGGGSAP